MTPPQRVRRALLSAHEKSGIVDFARALASEFQTEIISTGGSAAALRSAAIPVTLIEELTGFPEMLGGRVKTLHPRVHAAILANRDDPQHVAELAAAGIPPIDLVYVNLYPFAQTVADPTCTPQQALEMIDIGGVALLRAAAKNHAHIIVPPTAAELSSVLALLRDATLTQDDWRRIRHEYAARVFELVAEYDAQIAAWIRGAAPRPTTLQLETRAVLRYGENQQQSAELCELRGAAPRLSLLHAAEGMRHSVPMSYNNYLDADAAVQLCAELSRAALALSATGAAPAVCVFVKHNNACGVGVHADAYEAYRRAYLGDPNAAMGGMLAVNFSVDVRFAQHVLTTFAELGKPLRDANASYAPGGFFCEVWAAPHFTRDALALLAGDYSPQNAQPQAGEPRLPSPVLKDWGPRVRTLRVADLATSATASANAAPQRVYRSIAGGLLVQSADELGLNESDWQVVSARAPTPAELRDLRLAWLICKHTRSNAICLVRDGMLLGSGAGQMSRVMSCRIARWLAEENGHLPGSDGGAMPPPVAASDAFFPFADGPKILLDAGVRALIEPGGSKRDDEVIAVCDAADAALIFTQVRHFRH